ncbi:MAG: ATP-binding cassette domain-containing protein [Gammaproteobacteria bacterium]|nr:ATP-binding cassette domain-containing protein [Gammaproteobacteria bacterium]
MPASNTDSDDAIVVENLSLAYGKQVIQKELNFIVQRNDIFIIMGNSGSGKSTLMRAMTGLNKPESGDVFYYDMHGVNDESIASGMSCLKHDGQTFVKAQAQLKATGFWHSTTPIQLKIMEQFGVMFQNGALFSSMTLIENVSLRLFETTKYSPRRIRQIAKFKLSLVGLKGFEDYYPSQISGGMQKRVGIARAMAMDPPILFFDEPSAGLDPASSKLLDDLLLELKESLGITMVIVTHELDSIFTIGSNAIFLDHDQKTIIAQGHPKEMLRNNHHAQVQAFLSRKVQNENSN